MITNTPIRGLSNEVALDTASTVKAFFELCQAADPNSGYVALLPEVQKQVVAINNAMGMVGSSQSALIKALEGLTEAQFDSPGFQKLIADLERVVSQVDSAISDVYMTHPTILKLWQKNLDLMASQNSHIDSYVESFRVSFDESCSALLADLVVKVSAA